MIEQRLEEAQALTRIGKSNDVLTKSLSDSTIRAESDVWQNATAFYTVLQRLSLTDANLALSLQPVQAFFQTKRTKGKERANAKSRKKAKLEKQVGDAPPESPGDTSSNGASANGAASGGANAPPPPAPGRDALTKRRREQKRKSPARESVSGFSLVEGTRSYGPASAAALALGRKTRIRRA